MDTIKKYRKKPVVITAWQTSDSLDIKTLEGEMHASPGDWIITGVNGEQYPCKPDIFEKTYEPADLEPMPDARELAMKISDAADRGYEYANSSDDVFTEAAQLIAAHDARLLDEAAEKAKVYCKSYGFTFMVDQFLTGLDAAIKGAAHGQ